jgi:hypothetical protein
VPRFGARTTFWRVFRGHDVSRRAVESESTVCDLNLLVREFDSARGFCGSGQSRGSDSLRVFLLPLSAQHGARRGRRAQRSRSWRSSRPSRRRTRARARWRPISARCVSLRASSRSRARVQM